MSASYPDNQCWRKGISEAEEKYGILYLGIAFMDVVYSKLVELAGTDLQ